MSTMNKNGSTFISNVHGIIVFLIGISLLCASQALANEEQVVSISPEILKEMGTGTIEESEKVEQVVPDDVQYHEPVMQIFHSKTCPHCRNLLAFIDKKIAPKYPTLKIRLYEMSDDAHRPLLTELAEQYEATKYLGVVPFVFVGTKYFVGFDSDLVTGKAIEDAIIELLGEDAIVSASEENPPSETYTPGQKISLPFVGEIDPMRYSLPVLAILLGFLDGFNVCSLGALVLIIGLTLKLQRRRAIILFGGTFLLVTALVYGILIFLWYKLFATIGGYLDIMTTLIALLSLGGGLYFLKEYFRMRKQGAVCEFHESRIIQKITERTGKAFENAGTLLTILGAVTLFAFVVAVVEFPCSAAVPMIFASMLADLGFSQMGSLPYIALYILFYLFDEIVIFGIAAYKLKVWMTSGTFTKWAVLAEAFILIGIALYYLGTLAGVV